MQDVGSAELRPYHRGMTSLRAVLCVIAAAGLAGTIGLAADDRVVRVYPLELIDPASATELIRGMLSPGGRVVEDAPNRRIVVLDVPAVQARVAEALKTLRVPARNVRITVTHSSERVEDASHFGVTTSSSRSTLET